MERAEKRYPALDPLFVRDRKAVAEYLVVHAERIRSVARRKLSAATRSVYDSEEVFSSVLRRVDTLVEKGQLHPRSEAELWALVEAIARNNAINRTKLIERARNLLTQEGPYVYELLKRLNFYASDDEAHVLVYRMLACLPEEVDRRILGLYMRGASHAAIASLLHITVEASRQRWMRIRRELEARFQKGDLDG